ncbi:MAG: hypothetical protein NVS1B4_21720 [Gemmatimonadaceae bacterium]
MPMPSVTLAPLDAASVGSTANDTSAGDDLAPPASRVRALLRDSGLHAVLRFLNSRARFRFTGIYRAEPPMLRNIQLFDRENPGLTISGDVTALNDSYCSLTLASGEPFITHNAAADPHLHDHPRRNSILSYAGVPIRMPGGFVWGTLCHFDLRPRLVPRVEMPVLESVAPLIADWVVTRTRND